MTAGGLLISKPVYLGESLEYRHNTRFFSLPLIIIRIVPTAN